jgi:hypothetical protein
LIGLGLSGRVAAQRDTSGLAPPCAIAVDGKPLDASAEGKGGLVYDNAYPWVGDCDGSAKLALLIGHRDYRSPVPAQAKEDRPGRLRTYRNSTPRSNLARRESYHPCLLSTS